MKTCPHCQQSIPLEARECKFCHRAVVRACPHCAGEVYYTARVCRHCSQDVGAAPPPGGPGAPPAVTLRQFGPVGEERNLVLWVIVGLFTACIGPMIWIWQMGKEINAHAGSERLNPLLDLVLIPLTCGLWILVVFYRYADTFAALVREEGGEARGDLALICLLVGFFVPAAGLALIQSEMNDHWKKHGPQAHA
jgi:hypothetical protein